MSDRFSELARERVPLLEAKFGDGLDAAGQARLDAIHAEMEAIEMAEMAPNFARMERLCVEAEAVAARVAVLVAEAEALS